MNIYMRIGAAIAAASVVSGCATVTRGTKEKFEIRSQPPGADVSMTTGERCTTPCHLKLKRKTGFVATVAKPGYKPAQITVDSKMHGGGTAGVAGNVIAGGLIGIVVDSSNGSLNDLRPNPIDVTLVPEGESGPAVTPGVTPPVAAPNER